MEATRSELERPTDPHTLPLVPGVRSGFCFPLGIQQKPTLGLVSSLVSSCKNDPASLIIDMTSNSLLRFFAPFALRSLSRAGLEVVFSNQSPGDEARAEVSSGSAG